LQFGRLEGAELICSWHGCRWDVRSGRRADGGQARLAVFPVRVDGGNIEIAVGVEPVAAG
jgi:nitrite reductase/ring-hydroxylating ferredoxin subunit